MLSMMNIRMMAKNHRIGRISYRQLHTILSLETIKPSSPIPFHLQTRELSLIDHIVPNIHMPFLFFYKNYNKNSDLNILKKSLSQSLTQYYPIAGRYFLAPNSSASAPAAHIDCTDPGVEFYEASIDSRIHDFVVKKEQDETLDQLLPDSLGCVGNKNSPHMGKVQLNHFTCGGVAVVVSVSHKVADALTMLSFINHWATVTFCGTPDDPIFFPNSSTSSVQVPEYLAVQPGESKIIKYAIRRFVFPNSKLNDLKSKINNMGRGTTHLVNPSRAESLTSLLFKSAADAVDTINSGSPLSLSVVVNLREKTIKEYSNLAAGNIAITLIPKLQTDSRKIELNEIITNLRKEITELQGVRDMKEAGEKLAKTVLALVNDDQSRRVITFSSVCRFPFYQVDFGWGKPERVIIRAGNVDGACVTFMDTPSGDGIEATVQLEEEEMAVFQEDKNLLAYVQDNIVV